ncbi:Gamma-glutamylputrescine synthetase PuuA [Rickettsiales bacterium Ac37b]|nr:Gamma-glutamylputrescine synthetase PuuA [Rickettsiales bacterium Ac37b]
MILELLSDLETKKVILDTLHQNFLHNLQISLQLGTELEFYLSENISLDQLSIFLKPLLNKENIVFEKEKGNNQYELKLPIMTDPCVLAKKLTYIKSTMLELLAIHNIDIIFLAKPYPDQIGSSLHIHLSLWKEEKNLLEKDHEVESDTMLNAIGGMCALMLESMIFFAPTENCYKRFTRNHEAPTTVSWGGNNRTTALRIPSSPPGKRRIEHRVSSSASDPYLALTAILISVFYGIKNKILAPKRIYGNASDNQYQLKQLPKNLLESLNLFENSIIIKPWIYKLIN